MNKSDVVIIGSGPAGLTAAIYAARARLKTLVLTGDEPGGQLTTATEVENYPGFFSLKHKGILGPQLVADMRRQAEHFGAQFLLARAEKITVNQKEEGRLFIVKTNTNQEITAPAVIVATGASPRELGVPGERELRGRGVSVCATCDAAFFKDKIVVVIGGGNSALTEAEFLTRFAKKVFLIHRREHYRAEVILQERIRQNPKIIPLFNTQVKEFLGEERLTGLLLESKLEVDTGEYAQEVAQYPDKFGTQLSNSVRSDKNRQPDSDSFSWQLAVDGAFVAIGHRPNTEFLKGFLELDEKGYIKTRDEVFTSVEGVFAAGDCADYRYQQAITAAAMGCKAALEVIRRLSSAS